MKIDKGNAVPIYHQLRLLLEHEIRRGRFRVGDMIPGEIRLSRQFGVGRMTVRQSLDALVKEGFIVRRRGRGTVVTSALSSRETRASNIGVVIYKAALQAQWAFPEIIAGIHKGLEKYRANIVLLPFDEDTPRGPDRSFLQPLLSEKQLEGVLVTAEELPESELAVLERNGIPFVLVNSFLKRAHDQSVSFDSENGIRSIVQHLVQLGHRRIAYIGILFSVYQTERVMLYGFLRGMREAGFAVKPAYIKEASYLGGNTAHLLHELLADEEPPTAIACCEDHVALKAVQAITRLGLCVPNDISVTGMNDLPLAQLAIPPLTTLRAPRFELGRLAAELLGRLMENKPRLEGDIRCQRRLPLELVVRGSCRAVS